MFVGVKPGISLGKKKAETKLVSGLCVKLSNKESISQAGLWRDTITGDNAGLGCVCEREDCDCGGQILDEAALYKSQKLCSEVLYLLSCSFLDWWAFKRCCFLVTLPHRPGVDTRAGPGLRCAAFRSLTRLCSTPRRKQDPCGHVVVSAGSVFLTRRYCGVVFRDFHLLLRHRRPPASYRPPGPLHQVRLVFNFI